MRLGPTTIPVLLGIVIAFGSVTIAEAATVKASLTVKSQPFKSSGISGNRTFSVGANEAKAGTKVDNKAKINKEYTANDSLTVTATASDFNAKGATTATGTSTMNVGGLQAGGAFAYTMTADATVTPTAAGSPSGFAVARVGDPQQLAPDLSGEFADTITLAAGSLLFEEIGLGNASATFRLWSSTFEDPILSILLGASTAVSGVSAIFADVTYNTAEPIFYSISESEFEDLLEAPSNGLGDISTGLLSDISLTYGWNEADIPGAFTLSSEAQTYAAVVPIPASGGLLLSGFALALGALRRRRAQ